jgi:membrane-associated protein
MFDLEKILPAIGYLGIFAIIFAESGLLIGFIFPGDSLLFTAGFLASVGVFDIRLLVFLCFIASVSGDNAGYLFGHKVGRKLFHKKESLFFHKENLKKTEEFYKKHGRKTLILAKFIPVVRTFATIIAGIGSMNYLTFFSFNLIAGFLWAICIPMLGYYLGKSIPDVDKYLLPIIFVIIILSVSPTIIHLIKNKEMRTDIINLIKKAIKKVFPKTS